MTTSQITQSDSPLAKLKMYLIAILLGTAVGFIVSGFIWAVTKLKNLLWQNYQWNYEGWTVFFICVTGGLLVGLINHISKQSGESIHDLDEALDEVQKIETEDVPKFSTLFRRITLGVTSLGFGGPLGPEAPVIEIATGLSARISALLKIARSQAANLTVAGALGGLFGAPLAVATSELTADDQSQSSKRNMANLGPQILAGVSAFLIFRQLLPGNGFNTFESSVAHAQNLFGRNLFFVILAAVIVAAWIRGIVGVISKVHDVLWRFLPGGAITAGLLSGIVLGIGGVTNKLVLFSGHHEIQELLNEKPSWQYLLGVMLLKVVVLVACLSGGWFGGQIFPMAFIGVAISLAVGEIFTGSDAFMLAGVGFVAAVTVSLRKPVLSIILGLLFFPPETWIALMLGVACAVPLIADRDK